MTRASRSPVLTRQDAETPAAARKRAQLARASLEGARARYMNILLLGNNAEAAEASARGVAGGASRHLHTIASAAPDLLPPWKEEMEKFGWRA